jgi:hypothetical protein
MQSVGTRGRLLAGAALGLGLSILPQQAQAACTVTATTVTCGTTTTTNTSNAGGSPASDRNYPVNTSPGNFTGTISAGATVDGYGLAFTNSAGANDLNVVNDGTVQVNAGNTPSVGGSSAALDISAVGATDINYSGAGDIMNLGIGDGLQIDSNGTGNITAIVGGSVTSTTADAIDFVHTGTAGNLSITTTAGEVLTASDGGIEAEITGAANAGTLTVVNNADIVGGTDEGILATSLGSGAVSVTNNGDIGTTAVRFNNAVQAEVGAAGSAAALGVTGTGAVFAIGDAVIATNAGTGTTTVNYTGAIDTTTGDGIFATSTTGALSVTSGAITTVGQNGILTTSTSGNQTISVGGNITGSTDGVDATSTSGAISVTTTGGADITGLDDAISVATSGAMTVNIGAGSAVSGDFGVYGSGGGTLAVTNAGTLGTTGTTAVVTELDTAATVTNQAGGVINGMFDLSDLDDSVTNAGTLNLDGAQDFFLGTDTLTNQTGGTVNVAAGVTFNGLETLNNAATLNAAAGLLFDAGATTLTNTGTLNAQGALDFGGGADSFVNSGAGIVNINADTTLVGLETMTNTGTINLNTFTLTGTGVAFSNAGTIATSGSATLAGFTTLGNTGTMDLAPGTLTVPAAVFTNSGTIIADAGATTITGQTGFANSGAIDLQDGAVGDVLTINSAFVGSGASNLLVDFSTAGSDQLVINGDASGSTVINANFLSGGLVNLDGVLVVDATTATNGAFTLGTVGGDTPLVDFSLVQDGADFFIISAPNAAAFNPLVVPGFATDLWYQSANEVFAQTSKPASTAGISFWGEGYISRDKYGDDDDTVTLDGVDFDVDNGLKNKRHGVQLGVDYGYAGGGRVGVTGGYGWAKANGNADADLKAKGWNLGLYGQFGGLTGFHGEFLAKHDRYKAEFDDGVFDGTDFDIRSTGVDGSLGFRFGMGADGNMDIMAGVSHVRTKVDDIEAFGFNYDTSRLTSTRGRAGVRAVFGGSLAPYVAATAYHEFKGDGEIVLFDGADNFDLNTNGKGTWGRIEAGVNGNDGPGPILGLWGDFGDRKGLGLRAGFRFGGGIVEAAPPPPPPPAPPPPEAPATQTCADGSVILATDTCSLPPPPPPPPAPEPERG